MVGALSVGLAVWLQVVERGMGAGEGWASVCMWGAVGSCGVPGWQGKESGEHQSRAEGPQQDVVVT